MANQDQTKAVVITGCSSGIGWGTAKVLIAKQFKIYGSVRKPEDGQKLKREFGEAFEPLVFDVTDDEAIRRSAESLSDQLGGQNLAGLVNNAGVAVSGPLSYLEPDEITRQLDINLVGAFRTTKHFLPLLGTDPDRAGDPGRIVNISSVGGKIASPFLGAYAASKHGLEGLTEAWRRELVVHGIDMIIVAPGAVATPIWDKAQDDDISRFEGTEYYDTLAQFKEYFLEQGKKGFPPEKVGRVVLKALTDPKPKVRYPVVRHPVINWILPRLLPKRTVDRVMADRLGLKANTAD